MKSPIIRIGTFCLFLALIAGFVCYQCGVLDDKTEQTDITTNPDTEPSVTNDIIIPSSKSAPIIDRVTIGDEAEEVPLELQFENKKEKMDSQTLKKAERFRFLMMGSKSTLIGNQYRDSLSILLKSLD